MKRTTAVLISCLALMFPSVAMANVSATISNNDPGSVNTISISNSQINGLANQSSSFQSQITTDVTVTTNGETKTYHSTGSDSNVNVQSSDGKSSVIINNNVNTGGISKSNNKTQVQGVSIVASSSATPSPSLSASESATPSASPVQDSNFNIREFIEKQLEMIQKIREDILKAFFH